MENEMHELRSIGPELVTPDRGDDSVGAGGLHAPEVNLAGRKMNGLRVYVNILPEERAKDSGAFYSRRENGPFYRWTLADRHWSASRVSSANFSSKDLSATSWKLVPTALQRSIVDHYQD
ncbi:MAG TPA: hypothetical protein VIT19_10085 [Pyrinomonadaceae bacterium]